MTTIKANPDATNSELDAKVIIKKPELTDAQRDTLIILSNLKDDLC